MSVSAPKAGRFPMLEMRPISAGGRLPQWLRLLGPAFVVSIGYIDPGNWGTDLAAGTFGDRLLWVVLVANAMALVLQVAIAELTVVTSTDFASAIVRRWPRARRPLWLVFGGAAIATDIAEFAGIVLGLQLLMHLPTTVAVVAGIAIVLTILQASDTFTKGLEIGAICALAVIACACFGQVPALHPDPGAVLRGAVLPSIPSGAIVVIVGIVGATVMPHNLFLHSALVHRSAQGKSPADRRTMKRLFGRETFVALNVAALVNIALILIGAAVGGAGGSLQHAFAMLYRAGGSAALLFGGGLLLSGIAASTTATAAGDAIFKAFGPKPMPRIGRRALTLLPAAVLLLLGAHLGAMLLWSQVALALVLPVALVPLVALLVTHRRRMRRGTLVAFAAAITSALCVAFDATMLVQMLRPA